MSIEIAEHPGDITVLAVQGRLDSVTSSQLDERLAALVGTGPVMIVDMGDLNYVSSAGLRILLKAAKQAKARSSRFLLCALHPNVQEVFDISGFSGIFSIYPTLTAARAAV